MKLLTQLTANATAEGDIAHPRGVLTALHIEDETCRGWYLELALTPAGLRLKARRPDGQSAGIPLADLLALFRTSAPELFADPETIAKTQAALVGRDSVKPTSTPRRERPAEPTRAEREAGARSIAPPLDHQSNS